MPKIILQTNDTGFQLLIEGSREEVTELLALALHANPLFKMAVQDALDGQDYINDKVKIEPIKRIPKF